MGRKEDVTSSIELEKVNEQENSPVQSKAEITKADINATTVTEEDDVAKK